MKADNSRRRKTVKKVKEKNKRVKANEEKKSVFARAVKNVAECGEGAGRGAFTLADR